MGQSNITDKMYHRLYRLMKRGVEPVSIAATLNLPLNTVITIVSRLKNGDNTSAQQSSAAAQSYLDIYFFQETRYSKLQIVGSITEPHLEKLEQEFEKVLKSKFKVVAMEMCDATELDEACSKAILGFYNRMKDIGHFTAILDPSSDVDSSLQKWGLEETVPIFGTTSAFIDRAFSKMQSF